MRAAAAVPAALLCLVAALQVWTVLDRRALAARAIVAEACSEATRATNRAAFAIFALQDRLERDGTLAVDATEATLAGVLGDARAGLDHLGRIADSVDGEAERRLREAALDTLRLSEFSGTGQADAMGRLVDWAVDVDPLVREICA